MRLLQCTLFIITFISMNNFVFIISRIVFRSSNQKFRNKTYFWQFKLLFQPLSKVTGLKNMNYKTLFTFTNAQHFLYIFML